MIIPAGKIIDPDPIDYRREQFDEENRPFYGDGGTRPEGPLSTRVSPLKNKVNLDYFLTRIFLAADFFLSFQRIS